MVHEFEGKTEKEAIDNAIESLGLNRDEIDVEILENKKKGFLWGGGKVKIRVHLGDYFDEQQEPLTPEDEGEIKINDFLNELVKHMGFDAHVLMSFREEDRIGFEIQSDNTAVIIGKQGKTLDAFQLLANVYAGRICDRRIKVVVDAENYRQRRERHLIRFAHKVADQVRKSKGSKLLDPMNPFERRLIHTALNSQENIETISEGEGLYKKIRVFYRE
jgi:spoIIIJ-associated protein